MISLANGSLSGRAPFAKLNGSFGSTQRFNIRQPINVVGVCSKQAGGKIVACSAQGTVTTVPTGKK